MTTISRIVPVTQLPVAMPAPGVPDAGVAPPVGSPVDPPGAGPATPPPGPQIPPPGTPDVPVVPSRPPITNGAPGLVDDLTEATRLAARAVEMLSTVPPSDTGSESTKELRIRIFKTDMAAQKRIEEQLALTNPQDVLSDLRKADAYLEDANWQLARKPSPDGRFNGVDIPGATRDLLEGTRILQSLLNAATGNAGGGGTLPGAPPAQPPTTPPPTGTPSPLPPPTTPAPPAGGDDSYPGEDEFPTDDKILTGGDS